MSVMKRYHGGLTDANIRNIFSEAADLNVRKLQRDGFTLYIYAIDGLTGSRDISQFVIQPIMEALPGETMAELYRNALEGAVVNSVAKPCQNLKDVAGFLVNGFCVVLFEGVGAIAFETKTGEKRSISVPDLEHTAKGAKDAFTETIRTNTGLLRRHLRTPELRIYETVVGRRSLTNVAVVWIDGLTNEEYVNRLKQRLSELDIDGLLTPASVEEYVTGSRKTAFPLLQYTERTDRFSTGLVRGRVGLLVDGIPLGYLLPVDIAYLMDSPEDLSRDYITASWVRVLRYGALVLSLLLPALYIIMMVHHFSWIPDPLRTVLLENAVPFSPVWEVLSLLLAFELLQESGVHLPQSIGQSVSIIGGIVVGTAGVEAGVISSMALIMVSIAGVCGFVLPNRDLAAAVRVWRFFLAVLGSLAGFAGVVLGFGLLILHLLRLKSLGVPYLILCPPTIFRKRLVREKCRDPHLNPRDRRNQR